MADLNAHTFSQHLQCQPFNDCRLDRARALTFNDADAAQAHRSIDFDAMQCELQAVQQLCEQTKSPHVFCHNDLLSGNILVMGYRAGSDVSAIVQHNANLQLQLIDFEYGCFSYRGYDWGAPCLFSTAHYQPVLSLCGHLALEGLSAATAGASAP